MRIDHVIWKADDLDRGAAHVTAEYGLREGGGGRHVGIGTHNRTFPLGGGYLEVLAVIDPEEATRSPLGQAIVAAPEGLFGWAVAVEDVEAVAERLGLALMRIERDGMTASLAGVDESMAEPPLPFFIQRDPGSVNPSLRGDAGGIAWLELGGDAERMRTWLDGADLALRFADGAPGLHAVGLGSGAVIR